MNVGSGTQEPETKVALVQTSYIDLLRLHLLWLDNIKFGSGVGGEFTRWIG
jgi:hypothetical protein